MYRRNLLLAAGASIVAGCTTTSGGSSDPAAKRAEINAEVDKALSDLYAKVPGSRELLVSARGVLVFPKVISAGFVVGGSYGEGSLRKSGTTAGYYSMGAGSVGLLAGAQSKAVYLLFMSQEALTKFEASKDGWTAGVDASVALINVGADAQATSQTLKAPIIGYVLTNAGLMANLSFDGTKFTKLAL
ncbi:MAG TPA: YSC84-related protein [Rhizobacter sp.]|nr:YSC84-related protein [Rhizobacter sp.]